MKSSLYSSLLLGGDQSRFLSALPPVRASRQTTHPHIPAELEVSAPAAETAGMGMWKFPELGVARVSGERPYARNCGARRDSCPVAPRVKHERKSSGTVGWGRTTDLRIHNLLTYV